jgi:hypothetical protein
MTKSMQGLQCLVDATRGSGSYTIYRLYAYNWKGATSAVIVATILAPITVWLAYKQQSRLMRLEVGPTRQKRRSLLERLRGSRRPREEIRSWYITISFFPSMAAISCWLSVVFPNLAIAFEVLYVVFEAVVLTRFAYIVLVLCNGGVSVLERYLQMRKEEKRVLERQRRRDAAMGMGMGVGWTEAKDDPLLFSDGDGDVNGDGNDDGTSSSSSSSAAAAAAAAEGQPESPVRHRHLLGRKGSKRRQLVKALHPPALYLEIFYPRLRAASSNAAAEAVAAAAHREHAIAEFCGSETSSVRSFQASSVGEPVATDPEEDHLAEQSHREDSKAKVPVPTLHPINKCLIFLYQFAILGPLCALGEAICLYSAVNEHELQDDGSPDEAKRGFRLAETTFSCLSMATTGMAMSSLIYMIFRFHKSPELRGARVKWKFGAMKGMVFVGSLQGIIIGIVIQCGNLREDRVFPPPVSQNIWQALFFLVELPILQLAINTAYPANDFLPGGRSDSILESHGELGDQRDGVFYFEPRTPHAQAATNPLAAGVVSVHDDLIMASAAEAAEHVAAAAE